MKIISRLVRKLENMGKDALKILDVENQYLLCEMKVKSPPYRLYVVADQKAENSILLTGNTKRNKKMS